MRLNFLTRSLPAQILTGLLVGAALGGLLNAIGPVAPAARWFADHFADPIGQIFLRLLQLLVIPLIFASLVSGAAALGDMRELGRIGLRCIVYTVVVSAISVLIGLAIAQWIRPGDRVDDGVRAELTERYSRDAAARIENVESQRGPSDPPLLAAVKATLPTNIFAALAADPPNLLGLMFFALFLGAAAAMVGEPARPFLDFSQGLYEVVLRCIDLVMKLAPLAVFCLVFALTARFGFGLLASLSWFAGSVIGGLALHMFGVYSLILIFLVKVNPIEFFSRIRTVLITAFSTASSSATLPTALHVSEKNLGVPREINGFVLTIGATANQNGTALYEGATILFLAQLAGVDLTLAQQATVLGMAILGGIGTAGVPGGSLPFIILVAASLGVDPALIAVVLGVDRLLDMCRTTLNVAGDVTLALYNARAEGHPIMPELTDRA